MQGGLSHFQLLPESIRGGSFATAGDCGRVAGVAAFGAPFRLQPDGAANSGLPCLFGNNCNDAEGNPTASTPKAKLTGYQKKRAESIQQNTTGLIESVGIEHVGMMTLTFDPKRYGGSLSVQEANKKWHSLVTGCLSKSEKFGVWMRVIEHQANGMPHFHVLIECKEAIRGDFDFVHLAKVQQWQKAGSRGPKPRGELRRNPALKAIHELLNAKCKEYGFGRTELTPIRDAKGIGFYVGGYLSKSVANKPLDAIGSRYVAYSSGFRRRVKGQFAWNNPRAWVYRQKTGAFAARLGFFGDDVFPGLRSVAGPHWAYKLQEAILRTKLHYWPTMAHYEADGNNDGSFRRDLIENGCEDPDSLANINATCHGPNWQEIAKEKQSVPAPSLSQGAISPRSYNLTERPANPDAFRAASQKRLESAIARAEANQRKRDLQDFFAGRLAGSARSGPMRPEHPLPTGSGRHDNFSPV